MRTLNAERKRKIKLDTGPIEMQVDTYPYYCRIYNQSALIRQLWDFCNRGPRMPTCLVLWKSTMSHHVIYTAGETLNEYIAS